ncbi:MAG: hypothetical protein HRT68_10610 [Flavobacteriaceae bacterium]|nr:hypothetical protein [Flavobacteriaceae bacterium]
MFISSIDQNLAFKNSSEKDVHLNAEASGLYQFDITFKDPKGPPVSENYFKLLGKEFINYSGVMGGVYNSRNTFISGLLLIEHEHFGSEAPLLIKNHAFASKRKWTGMMTSNKNRQGGNSERKYSYPGKIHLIYSSEDGKDLKIDFRTIGFGDGYLGSQMLLLNLDDFESIEFDIDIKKPNNINKNFVLIPKNNFPDILDNDDRISYVWIHPNGSIIGFQKNITLENFSNPDKGIYSLHIKFLNHFITKTVNIQPNISP